MRRVVFGPGVLLMLMASAPSLADEAPEVREAPYDRGLACGAAITIQESASDPVQTSEVCQDNETARRGFLQAGGVPVPGVRTTSHRVPCPPGCIPSCTPVGCCPWITCCLPLLCGSGDVTVPAVGVGARPSPDTVHVLERIAVGWKGDLSVSTLISGSSVNGACLTVTSAEAIAGPVCSPTTDAEDSLTVTIPARPYEPLWVDVWIEAPGALVVRTISYGRA